jgi:peptide/nickel transport system substrate-binding protein
VIFSITRAKMEGSDMGYTVNSVKEVKKIDDLTVDMVLEKPIRSCPTRSPRPI